MQQFGTFYAAQGVELDTRTLPHPASYDPLSSEETRVLADRGYLTEMSDAEEIAMVARVAEVLHDEAAKHPSFLALPTLDCNYRCTYCFERPVQNNLTRMNRQRHKELDLLDIRASHRSKNVVMTPAVVNAMFLAIDRARELHGDDRDSIQVVLYGGEPLDADNEAVVRSIVTTGSAKGYRFSAITNGHDLDTFLDLFGPNGIKQVQVSIDGPARIHNTRRITLDATNSYERIVSNVNKLLDRRDTLVQVRVHLDQTNVEYFEELLHDFNHIGWLDHPDLLIYANTVYKLQPGSPVAADINLDELDQRLRELAQRHRNIMLNAPSINMRAKWMPSLLKGDQVPLQGNYCSANTGQYVFAPDGHFYACWESVGKADSRIGSFYSESEGPMFQLDHKQSTAWFSRHVGLIPECNTCPMALMCGGGCAQFSIYNNGTQLAPYCDNFDALMRSGMSETTDIMLNRMRDAVAGVAREGLVAANY